MKLQQIQQYQRVSKELDNLKKEYQELRKKNKRKDSQIQKSQTPVQKSQKPVQKQIQKSQKQIQKSQTPVQKQQKQQTTKVVDLLPYNEIKISGIVKKMKHMFDNAKYRTDYDNIIKTFNIKIIKNFWHGKKVKEYDKIIESFFMVNDFVTL